MMTMVSCDWSGDGRGLAAAIDKGREGDGGAGAGGASIGSGFGHHDANVGGELCLP